MRAKEFIIKQSMAEGQINELVGVKGELAKTDWTKTDWKNRIPYNQLLRDKGFSSIGTGESSSVWKHPNLKYALKVFKDPAYLKWVHTSMQHKDNPYFPRFVSAKPIKLDKDFYAVRVEELNGVNLGELGKELEPFLRHNQLDVKINNLYDMQQYLEQNQDSFKGIF
jgi:hypothetical protein